MSLYIGRDYTNTPTLAITALPHTPSQMKNAAILSDIKFHSSLQYVTVKVFKSISINAVNNSAYSVLVGEFDDTATTYISSKMSTSIITITGFAGIVNNASYIWDWVDGNSFSCGAAACQKYSRVPNSTYRYKAISYNVANNTYNSDCMSVYVFNVSMSPTAYSLISPFKPSNSSISLTNSQIILGGSSIASINFLTSVNVLNAYKVYNKSGGNHVSILNYLNQSPTCFLHATSTEVSIINSNNEVLFSSAGGNRFIQKVSYANTYTLTSSDINTSASYDGATISSTDMLIIYMQFSIENIYSKVTENVSSTFIYMPSTTNLPLFSLSVTAQQTIYECGVYYSPSVSKIMLYRKLVRLGSDGNPGSPPKLDFITGLIVL